MDKIAFVFSGQGSQYPGMGKDIYDKYFVAREMYDRFESIYPNIKELCFSGDIQDLNRTIYAQPSIYCVSLACAKALNYEGIFPDAIAGFSLGEISAIAYNGILNYEDGLKLVIERAKIMQECAEQSDGSMVAVLGLKDSIVENLVSEIDNANCVNYNCPMQIVVSGDNKAIEEVIIKVKQLNGKAVKLAVNGAFHSRYMDDAASHIKKYLEDVIISKGNVPLYSNVNARPYNDDTKKLISQQISSPVLWSQLITNMHSNGINKYIEVGCGKVLCGLIKKILPSATVYNACDLDNFLTTIERIKLEQ